MRTIRSDNNWMIDVDDTLIIWDEKHERTLKMYEPLLGQYIHIAPNWNNIRLVKEKHIRGATIFVWSQGGYRWAEAVVKALGLEGYIEFVMSKPSGIIDDLPASEWMPKPICLNPDKPYKGG